MHPPNQMRPPVELRVNSNRVFRLGANVTHHDRAITRTSTSKLYFLTRFLVIFADFLGMDGARDALGPEEIFINELNRGTAITLMFVAG